MPVPCSKPSRPSEISVSLSCGFALLALTASARAEEEPTREPTVEVIEVTGAGPSLVGRAQTASEGVISKEQLDERPVYRVGELLETVPGLIVTQHSGEGKANQYFLRGFNLDHGTDLAIAVDDMPVNMRSHAHGQGYADLNFFMPELASGLQYRKGPYDAEDGDFATAGAVHLGYLDTLDHDLASISAGTLGDQRVFAAASRPLGAGNVLVAGEFAHLDGPFKIPDDFKKGNALLRYSQGTAENGWSVTGMYLIDSFHATNQIPLRAVKEGLIGPFDAIDPADGGNAERYSVSGKYVATTDHGRFKANAYVIADNFRLFSDVTFNLDFPDQGDQFKQQDHRWIYGADTSYTSFDKLFGFETENTIGFQFRDDQTHLTLARTTEQVQRFIVRDDNVTETSAGLYAENQIRWLDTFRTVEGLRGDVFYGSDASDAALNSGTTAKGLISPKLKMIFGPWATTEFYASVGRGYHSNDVRGAVTQFDPTTLLSSGTAQTQNKVPLLTAATGEEFGIRTGVVPHLMATAALFRLDLDSELTFSGDAGTTSAGRPSRREGIELTASYAPLEWLTIDADFAFSRARFSDEDTGANDTVAGHSGSFIPGSVKEDASIGITIDNLGPWDGGLEWRYFGPRPLIEDGSVRSGPTALLNGQIGYSVTESLKLRLDIFNLLNSHAHQIDYFYTSRLPGEPLAGVNDIHFHPSEPLSARVTVSVAL
jgi:outer membrane cobalamin receptor